MIGSIGNNAPMPHGGCGGGGTNNVARLVADPATTPRGRFPFPEFGVMAESATDAQTNVATTDSGSTTPATKSWLDAQKSAHESMMQSYVDGQWGPGGVTPIKGGGTGAGTDDCGIDHAATDANSTTPTSAVAGASGGGASTLASLNTQIMAIMEQVRRLTPSATSGGGAALAAASGASNLGSVDALRLSVNDLIDAIGQLNRALHDGAFGRGGPGQHPMWFPGMQRPPVPAKVDPPTTTTTPPAVEPPKTEVPRTESSSSSTTTSDTRAEASSGSSSS